MYRLGRLINLYEWLYSRFKKVEWRRNINTVCVVTWLSFNWGRNKMAAISQMTLSNAFSWMNVRISLKFVPKGPINNIPALIQIMALCRPGDKPLPEPMMVKLPTHICFTRPQWFKQRLKNERTQNSSGNTITMRSDEHQLDNINIPNNIPMSLYAQTFLPKAWTYAPIYIFEGSNYLTLRGIHCEWRRAHHCQISAPIPQL